ncbi:hypothetical protein AXK11_06790 [Cephaloticoccus primus]|uniref:Uncharacterized protein n=2 Tax=Cephaloticoccus primus TaxID=1548207 RepID=A0A139SKG3_9BACT|nr:hypothetical protein AXK11_06790 [Cephaloticoccus primus]
MAMEKHIRSAKLKVGDHVYQSAVAGLVVSYCRPFMSATGLGRIPADFGIFKDTSHSAFFASVHNDLIMMRDKMVAHFDLDYGVGQFTRKRYTLHPGEVGLSLREHGFEVYTNHTTLTRSRLLDVRKLISLQVERVKRAQAECVKSLINSEKTQMGDYIFRLGQPSRRD